MSGLLDWVSVALALLGTVFFAAGTVGLLRFPDTYSRLHAVTKADNLGLGFIVVALLLQSNTLLNAGKLLLIWLLAMLVGSTACFLIGRWTRRHDLEDPHGRS
jgi:multicomponent Na+:H+ antiporter subunit G